MIHRNAIPWIVAGVMTIIALISVIGVVTMATRTVQQPSAAIPSSAATPSPSPEPSGIVTEEPAEEPSPLGDPSFKPSASPTPGSKTKVDRNAPMSQAARDARPGQGPLPSDRPVTCPAATTKVTSAEDLTTALADAKPGSVIQLADGTYSGRFSATNSGTATQRIYLCGGRGAVLDAGNADKGYVFHLDGGSYWVLSGFTVRNGQKGIVTDSSIGSVLQNLAVTDTGDEAVHLRRHSSGNLIIGNTIRNAGSHNEKFGEGIYIGSAVSNWCTYTGCVADESNYNIIANNDIANTTSESIDIKEGTIGGIIRGNRFDGTGMTAATAWINVKGNAWTIDTNYGRNSPEDGYQTHRILQEWGDYNLFTNNTGTVDGPGYAFAIWPAMHNTVACSNSLASAGRGMSNIRCASI